MLTDHYDGVDGTDITRWMRLSPAVACCYKVYSRLLKGAPLTMVKPDGEVLRWPPKDGRSTKSAAYNVLRLWEDRPNEIHTAAQVRGMMAHEWIYRGEVIMPQHRDPNGHIRRFYVLPSSVVNINSFNRQFDWMFKQGVVYNWYGHKKVLNVKKPQFMHLRTNVDPFWPLRGRPIWQEMQTEVAANAISSIYRKEVFRQGGPVRVSLEADPESDIAHTANEEQLGRIASGVARNIKRMDSWMNEIVHIPPGFKLHDWGPKSNDEMYTEASRVTDEKIASAAGVPLLYLGNMERSTYTNSRQQISILVKEAGASFFEEIEQAIHRVQLAPLGGEAALMTPRFDLEHLIKAEIAVWNKIVLDRVAAGIMGVNEARTMLDHMPYEEKKYDKPIEPMMQKPGMGPKKKAPAGDAKGVAKPASDKV